MSTFQTKSLISTFSGLQQCFTAQTWVRKGNTDLGISTEFKGLTTCVEKLERRKWRCKLPICEDQNGRLTACQRSMQWSSVKKESEFGVSLALPSLQIMAVVFCWTRHRGGKLQRISINRMFDPRNLQDLSIIVNIDLCGKRAGANKYFAQDSSCPASAGTDQGASLSEAY